MHAYLAHCAKRGTTHGTGTASTWTLANLQIHKSATLWRHPDASKQLQGKLGES